MKKIIYATIELGNDEGTANLFWKKGQVWCERQSDKETWPIYDSHCKRADVKNTIYAMYHDGLDTWKLVLN